METIEKLLGPVTYLVRIYKQVHIDHILARQIESTKNKQPDDNWQSLDLLVTPI